LPTAAFAISQRTVGKFFDLDSLARFDISLSQLTMAVTLFLTALYLGPRPRESLLAISAKVSGRRCVIFVFLHHNSLQFMNWYIRRR
jgi:hypothetical protein